MEGILKKDLQVKEKGREREVRRLILSIPLSPGNSMSVRLRLSSGRTRGGRHRRTRVHHRDNFCRVVSCFLR